MGEGEAEQEVGGNMNGQERKKRRPAPRQPSPAPARPHEEDLTCHQVLEEAILDLFELGRQNEMTEDEIDEVLAKIMDERAAGRRKSFKVHGDGNPS